MDSGKHLHEPKGKFTKLLLVDGLPAVGEPESESVVGGPDMKDRVYSGAKLCRPIFLYCLVVREF